MPRCTGTTRKGKQCARMVAKGCECYQHKTPDECPICFEAIGKKDLLKTSCNHTFHYDCMKKWLETKSSCPCCRGKLKVGHTYINVYKDHTDVISWCPEVGYYMTKLPAGYYTYDGPDESISMTKELEFTHINRVHNTGYPFVIYDEEEEQVYGL